MRPFHEYEKPHSDNEQDILTNYKSYEESDYNLNLASLTILY